MVRIRPPLPLSRIICVTASGVAGPLLYPCIAVGVLPPDSAPAPFQSGKLRHVHAHGP